MLRYNYNIVVMIWPPNYVVILIQPAPRLIAQLFNILQLDFMRVYT